MPAGLATFTMTTITGVNAYGAELDMLKRRMAEGGYRIQATPHFLLGRHDPGAPGGLPALLVHWFPPDAIDSNLGHYLKEELKPLGILANPQQYGDVFGAIVNSVMPSDLGKVWYLFAENTLQRLSELMAGDGPAPNGTYPVERFAALYRRVQSLCSGTSLLDAGCSLGFLPLMMAERLPALTEVVGLDIDDGPFAIMRSIARERHLPQVRFVQADLLSDDVVGLSPFGTVTLLHVLEHLAESAMSVALSNLLRLTTRRLIIAVPYEKGEPEPAYGHEQLFTREKLEDVGRWCLRQWGEGSMRYEDCAGGLICLDRGDVDAPRPFR